MAVDPISTPPNQTSFRGRFLEPVSDSSPPQRGDASNDLSALQDEKNEKLKTVPEPIEEDEDSGRFGNKETSKPPELNVSQVWVQDSPQDYIDDRGIEGMSDDAARTRANIASLEKLKDWLLRRVNGLAADTLTQEHITAASRQWSAELEAVISSTRCAASLEKEMANKAVPR
ncbi:hypothetical protein BESB_069100 [Besnoitia besnoiti]|uniref:Uncharacterized protein n=1 Tax=Besnoitia besnoiti TaxID=94643 RepID=A0A2A9MH08_BESBE|nr:hypothetical protein BESB_069100 [Besnoitia besnoiti]PFH34877.1 hypothetical protein BESB_069100 [Besnoitia besnoiti]